MLTIYCWCQKRLQKWGCGYSNPCLAYSGSNSFLFYVKYWYLSLTGLQPLFPFSCFSSSFWKLYVNENTSPDISQHSLSPLQLLATQPTSSRITLIKLLILGANNFNFFFGHYCQYGIITHWSSSHCPGNSHQMVNSSCREAADHANKALDSGIIITGIA